MKFLRNFLIFILIIGIGAVCLSYYKLGGDMDNFGSIYNADSQYTKVEKSFTVGGRNIEIVAFSEDVVVTQGTDDQLHISYFESTRDTFDIVEGEDFISIKRNVLSSFKWENLFAFPRFTSSAVRKVVVVLPQQVNSLKISLGSGSVNMDSVTALNVDISVASGKVRIANLSTTDLTTSVVSGEFILSNSSATKLSVDVNSGDVLLSKIVSDDVSIEVVSGEVNGEIVGIKAEYTVEMHSVSGSTYLDGIKFSGKVNGTTNKKIDASIISGKCNVKFV